MDTLNMIRHYGVIAVLRGIERDRLLRVANALRNGGVRLIEVTFDQSGSIEDTANAIAALTDEFSFTMCIGAGTVMTKPQLVFAKEAGAKYIISPNTDGEIVQMTKAAGLVSIPGAFTPTEVANAHALGADMVKIFPAGQLGPKYFSALKAPLKHIPLAAVGGITLDNLDEFQRAGAEAFGISTGIVKPEFLKNEDYGMIERVASLYVERFRRE